MKGYIKGQFRKSIFSTDNGYIIGIFKVLETDLEDVSIYINRTITFTGYFHELNEIDKYKFFGSLVEHPKYGEQFQVDSYERCIPDNKDSMVEFLSSDLFTGIGEAKAKKIVSSLGKDTFNVIINNPSNLVLIPTITEKNAKVLHDKLIEYESSYETIIYLSKLGFSTKDSMIIYNKYKANTLEVIDNNIYILIDDIYEMTFKKIDMIAIKSNIDKDNPNRVKASIIYIMNELSNTYGHSYFYKEEIYSYIYRVLGINISEDLYNKCLENLEIDLKIIRKDDKYYLFNMYEAEKIISERFTLLSHEKDNKCDDIDDRILILENNFNITYNELQKVAIKKSFMKQFLIITGGPGTGKTTIIKAILELYKNINNYSNRDMIEKVALLAPTGRAAKRMSEATTHPASTIHRFLKWNKENDTFQINEYNKSKVEFVLIDEASMIDSYLFSNLLKGLSIHTKIIIVGDYDQLPSVSPGQVLSDLINSNMLEVVQLKELYRQGLDSNILTLAYDIHNDSLSKDIFNVSDDLTFIECSSNEVIDNIEDIATTYKDLSYRDFQILAPMYKTLNGIDNINNRLQNIFNEKNKNKKELLVGDVIYREGDKVIQLNNMPDLNVYNGDIGIIEKISTKPKEIHINFDGNIVKYTPSNFNKFRLAYAISIHKSQGSEFDIVVIPLVTNFKKMLFKKLIYTGVTRSKKKLYLIGEYNALQLAVKNTNNDTRRTTLKDFLINGIK